MGLQINDLTFEDGLVQQCFWCINSHCLHWQAILVFNVSAWYLSFGNAV
jgi:hypothetical protein